VGVSFAAGFVPPRFDEIEALPSPALVVDGTVFDANLALMIEIAGRADRLRPHCKTHKMAAVAKLEMSQGITKHKAATIAEVEMLAREGAKDVLLAYPAVGPQIGRVIALRKAFPELLLSVLVDDLSAAEALSAAAHASGLVQNVFVDLDVGQHRTGVAPENWLSVCQGIARLPGLRLAGLHVYDGHNSFAAPVERKAEVNRIWGLVQEILGRVQAQGLAIDEVVAGGTGSFAFWAQIDYPRLVLSPGTVVFYDAGYASKYQEMRFAPAVWVLSRVVSRPGVDKITLDAGYKSISGDPLLSQRAIFPEIADAKIVAQNEEHLVVETGYAKDLPPGTPVWLIPWHVCPTVALHRQAVVLREGKIVEEWSVSARDRVLSI
jgi:D-serine deaminase-like pyridoxal phosphate-dependent protein